MEFNILNIIKKGLTNYSGDSSAFSSSWGSSGARTYGITDYYKSTIYSATDAIASNVSNVKYTLQKPNDQTVEDHELLDVLAHPSADFGYNQLVYLVFSDMLLYGTSYIHKVRSVSGRKLLELEVYDPRKIGVVRDQYDQVIAYDYYRGDKTIRFDPKDIMPIFRPTPLHTDTGTFSKGRGVSVLERARLEAESDLRSTEWNLNFFKQGSRPSGILTTEASLSDAEFKRLKGEIKDTYSGMGNAHKPMLLENGLEWRQMSLSQKDLDFILQRQFSRDQILSIFKVPKPIVAITDQVNLANAKSAEYIFAKYTIDPYLDLFFDILNHQFVNEFDVEAKLIYDNPVPKDREQIVNEYTKAVNVWMTVNEVRTNEGLDPLDGGDELQAQNTVPEEKIEEEVVEDSKQKQIAVKEMNIYRAKKDLFMAVKIPVFRSLVKSTYNSMVNNVQYKMIKSNTQSFDVDRFRQEWFDTVKVIAGASYDAGSEIAGDSYGIGGTADSENYSNARALDSATQIVTTTEKKIRAKAKELQDKSEEYINEEIATMLKDQTDWRVELITDTETNSGWSKGTYDRYDMSDLVEYVEWLTSGRDNVCPICQGNANKIRKLGNEFPSGHVSPVVHSNCHCDIVPYFEDDAKELARN